MTDIVMGDQYSYSAVVTDSNNLPAQIRNYPLSGVLDGGVAGEYMITTDPEYTTVDQTLGNYFTDLPVNTSNFIYGVKIIIPTLWNTIDNNDFTFKFLLNLEKIQQDTSENPKTHSLAFNRIFFNYNALDSYSPKFTWGDEDNPYVKIDISDQIGDLVLVNDDHYEILLELHVTGNKCILYANGNASQEIESSDSLNYHTGGRDVGFYISKSESYQYDEYTYTAHIQGGFATNHYWIKACASDIENLSAATTDLEVLVFDTSVQNLQPITGATVTINGVTQTTSVDGFLTFANLIIGNTYTVTASSNGFNNYSLEYTIIENRRLDLGLVKILTSDEFRIVLTWGADPRDLDSHFSFPLETGERTKIWYSARDVSGRASLDVDDTDGYGPETTTFFIRNKTTNQVIPGVYRFSVHHYSGTSNISNSGATVRLYLQNGTIQTFLPPSDIIGGVNTVWAVFQLTVDSNGGSTIETLGTQYISAAPGVDTL